MRALGGGGEKHAECRKPDEGAQGQGHRLVSWMCARVKQRETDRMEAEKVGRKEVERGIELSGEGRERNSGNGDGQFLYLPASRKSFVVTSAPLDEWYIHETSRTKKYVLG